MELISIIVPVYNVENYLRKCINSIIGQTYKNLEIILVDDGSMDSSGKICDEYAKSDSRIKVIHKENGGLSDARNTGLNIANGKYISFVDSDDYIDSEMIKVLYERIQKDGSDMALCNFIYVDENENEIDELNVGMPVVDEILSSYETLEKLLLPIQGCYVIACNKLYKKELWNNIRFPKGKINEDEFVIHKLILSCKLISSVKRSMYFYVQRSESIMNTAYSVKRLDAAEAVLQRSNDLCDIEKYTLAAAFLRRAIGLMLYGYSTLNRKNPDVKDRLNELKRYYNQVYQKLILKKFDVRNKMQLTLFRCGFSLYLFFRKILNNISTEKEC